MSRGPDRARPTRGAWRSRAQYEAGPPGSPSFERLEEQWGTAATLEYLAPSVARDERFRRWYARYERLALGPRMLRAIVACDFENDLRSVLPVIRVPTLVLHRRDNRFIEVRQGRYLAEHIPNAVLVELPGQDHLFHVGETEAILGEIEHGEGSGRRLRHPFRRPRDSRPQRCAWRVAPVRRGMTA